MYLSFPCLWHRKSHSFPSSFRIELTRKTCSTPFFLVDRILLAKDGHHQVGWLGQMKQSYLQKAFRMGTEYGGRWY